MSSVVYNEPVFCKDCAYCKFDNKMVRVDWECVSPQDDAERKQYLVRELDTVYCYSKNTDGQCKDFIPRGPWWHRVLRRLGIRQESGLPKARIVE